MAVVGTYCQLCGIPVQHDHYVRTPGDPMMEIYRPGTGASASHASKRSFRFGPEHAWLGSAVAVSLAGATRGAARDGMIGDVLVGEGSEEGTALHAFCWTLMGQPEAEREVARSAGTHGWALVEPFQQQLFEFQLLVDHGLGWMLADPQVEPRSRARIDGLLRASRARGDDASAAAAGVPEVLGSDRAWRAEITDDAGLSLRRFRSDVRPGLDVSGYATLVWLMKEYGPRLRKAEITDAFHSFEVLLKQAVERDGAAVLIMAMYSPRQAQFVIYARDEAATCAVIDSLPRVDEPVAREYDNQSDPQWLSFFENDWPGR